MENQKTHHFVTIQSDIAEDTDAKNDSDNCTTFSGYSKISPTPTTHVNKQLSHRNFFRQTKNARPKRNTTSIS